MNITQQIFLSTKDVQGLKGGCSHDTAIKMIKKVRDIYNLPERTQITVEQFCKVYGISETLVLTAINNS